MKECKKHMKLKHPKVYYERYAPLQRGQCVEGGESFVCDQCGKIFQTSKVSPPTAERTMCGGRGELCV